MYATCIKKLNRANRMNHHHFEHIEHALGALEQGTNNTNVNERYYEKFKFNYVFWLLGSYPVGQFLNTRVL